MIQSVFDDFRCVLARLPRRKEFCSLIAVCVKNQFFRAFNIWDLLTLCPVPLPGEVVNSPEQLCALSEILSSVKLCDLCSRLKDPHAFNWWLYDPSLCYGSR